MIYLGNKPVGVTDSRLKMADVLLSGESSTPIAYENHCVETIRRYAFYGVENVTSFYSESVLTIDPYGFVSAPDLVTINLPNATTWTGSNAAQFSSCPNLVSVYLPSTSSAQGTPGIAFSNDTKLEIVDLGSAKSIYGTSFNNCPALHVLILRKTDSICGLVTSTALDSTCFAATGTGGIAYVPQSLIELYKASESWKALFDAGTCTFVPIEGSIYE